jgi:hypothetical protein
LNGTRSQFFTGGIEYFALGSGFFNTIPTQIYNIMNSKFGHIRNIFNQNKKEGISIKEKPLLHASKDVRIEHDC